MDNPTVNIISVCSGIGGLDHGVRNALRLCGYVPRTIAYVEGEAFACAVLDAHMQAGDMDAAPIWTRIESFPSGCFMGSVDMVIGGIPCQGFSVAGTRKGTKDDRWLWPDMWRIVKESGASVLFLENVPGFIHGGGLHAVLTDLAASGWNAEWDCFSAEQVGAPHRRERFFLLAYSDEFRWRVQCDKWPEQQRRTYAADASEEVADANIPQRNWGIRHKDATGINRYTDSGDVENPIGERRRGRYYGATTGNGGEIQTPGSCGAMGDTNSGSILESGRCAEERSRDEEADKHVGDTSGAGLERSEHGEACNCNGYREKAHGSVAESSEIPVWPPGPNDREAWERVIAMRPDLAPAVNGKLNPKMVSWLMGLPPDYVAIPGASRVDMLRALGNAVVQATAELAMMTLMERI